jgi:hypothetical protein
MDCTSCLRLLPSIRMFAAFGLLTSATVAVASDYSVRLVGSSAEPPIMVRDLSETGWIVGQRGVEGRQPPFRLAPNALEIELLPDLGGNGIAYGVNASGLAVGTVWRTGERPATWNLSGELSVANGAGQYWHIDDAGSFIVGRAASGRLSSVATFWRNGKATTLPGLGSASGATRLATNGEIAGWVQDGSQFKAVVWTPAAKGYTLQVLGPDFGSGDALPWISRNGRFVSAATRVYQRSASGWTVAADFDKHWSPESPDHRYQVLSVNSSGKAMVTYIHRPYAHTSAGSERRVFMWNGQDRVYVSDFLPGMTLGHHWVINDAGVMAGIVNWPGESLLIAILSPNL